MNKRKFVSTNSDDLLNINLKNYYFKRYEFHELCIIFPLISEQELNDLADDIRETSLFDPITLYEGKILDGKCRYITYFRAGVEPRYENINSTYNEYEEAYKLEFIMGVLNALYEDLKKNYLKNISELIHTEVFSNFLEMAIKK